MKTIRKPAVVISIMIQKVGLNGGQSEESCMLQCFEVNMIDDEINTIVKKYSDYSKS